MAETANREDWKSRYRELLEEMEQKEGDWQSLENSLRAVSSRLAITAMGRNDRIDQHLTGIIEAVKGRRSESHLLRSLEGLSEAVLNHENHIAADESIDLSAFVASLQLTPTNQKRFIDGLESDTPSQRNRALNDLATELNSLLQNSATTRDTETTQTVQKVLISMVRQMDGVPELEQAVDELNQRLTDGISEDALETLLENLALAVSSVIKSIGKDKQELEAFLEQVTVQLAQFETWARGSENEAAARRKDTDFLERNVEQQVDELQSDMESSSDMSMLKQRVQKRLDSIAGELQVFRQSEEQRSTEAVERNVALMQEVNRLKVRTSELAETCKKQENRLMHDTLTRVHSRYAYDQRLQEEFQRWQRHGQPLSYSLWDLDFFKKVNDNFGHQTGDRLLMVVANMLTESTRVEDFVARIGGEEFVVIFPATELEKAHALADRVREKIAAVGFHFKGQPIAVTVSCGITEFREGDTPQSVYERADKALYEAKEQGRNRCTQG
ncbi:MAG: diguanylate cyclase [Gammaproteobacteria bacterium]